jgi:hypothetical protein
MVIANSEGRGPLTQRVLAYERVMKALVPHVERPTDWGPLEEFIAVEEFERIGVFLEVQNWTEYAEMLTHWASLVDSFETTVRRISELPGLVYYEIEERHRRGDAVNRVNSLTVFTFGEDAKVRHLDVYLQQSQPART